MPIPPEDLRRIVREESAVAVKSATDQLHNDIRSLEASITGDGGLRDRLVRVETEIRFLRDPPRGRSRDDDRTPRPPRPSGGDSSSRSDGGGDVVTFRGTGWVRLAQWFLGAMVTAAAGAATTWMAMHSTAPTAAPVVAPYNRSAPIPAGPMSEEP